MDTTKEKTKEEKAKEIADSTYAEFSLKFKVSLPESEDLLSPDGANIRVCNEVLATLTKMKKLYPGIKFYFKRETSIPWTFVPLDDNDW